MGLTRVDIKKLLRDPSLRREMVAKSIIFIQAVEGRDLTLEDALAVYDRVHTEG